MTNEEAIKFGKEQLEIFGEGYNRGYAEGLSEGGDL